MTTRGSVIQRVSLVPIFTTSLRRESRRRGVPGAPRTGSWASAVEQPVAERRARQEEAGRGAPGNEDRPGAVRFVRDPLAQDETDDPGRRGIVGGIDLHAVDAV